MSRKTRSLPASVFGAPEDFIPSKLPTYLQVGKQFIKSKLDLQNQFPGKKHSLRDAAKVVREL